jgi:6-phosphogluconolactonase
MAQEIGIEVCEDYDRVMQAAAGEFAQAAAGAVRRSGRALIALSGGATPRGMHRLLGQSPYADEIPWERLHLFWSDERLVPYAHPDSNYGAARRDFLDALGRRPAGVHAIAVRGEPQGLARRYEATLREFLDAAAGEPAPGFDLVFLGVGSDGHTASLFPGSAALREPERWTAAVKGGRPDLWRVTLTPAVLNRARRIVVLAAGESKADVVGRALGGASAAAGLPVQDIRPAAGRLVWLLDRPAAARLTPEAIRRAARMEERD